MSENNDILEYIVQCLLTNRDQTKKVSKPVKGNNYILNINSNDLLNQNIQYIIQNKYINNFESCYEKYNVNLSYDFLKI